MDNDGREDLYDMIDDVGTAMLVTERGGELRSRPMKGKLYRDSGEIWFLTEIPSGKASEIAADETSNLTYACPEKETYISLSGRAVLNKDTDKIQDLWGPWAEAWLQCRIDDPKVSAIQFIPEIAEFWSSPESRLIQTWELAKAKLTGEKPQGGENLTMAMS